MRFTARAKPSAAAFVGCAAVAGPAVLGIALGASALLVPDRAAGAGGLDWPPPHPIASDPDTQHTLSATATRGPRAAGVTGPPTTPHPARTRRRQRTLERCMFRISARQGLC
ncbi:MAG TPA: hypothetical protein VHY83_06660 [Solirubrobacteraceae bacterium]|nr:hypothetical protein [Solirubrobacteraceae bacterium]